MVAIQVIMRGVFVDGVPQVPLADRDDLRQALLLDRPDEPLGVGVEVGAPRGCPHRLDPGRPQQGMELGAEERVPVVDQVPVLQQEPVEAIHEGPPRAAA